MSTEQPKTQTAPRGIPSGNPPPAVQWTALRFAGNRKPTPESPDGGKTWVLPFLPHNKQEVEIPPKHSAELDTGIRLVVPEGYEAHVSHVLRPGQPHLLRPCLVVASCDADKAVEIRVPVVNVSGEVLRFAPGRPLAYFTLVPLRSCVVEKT